MTPERQAELERRAERNRYFLGLEQAAKESQRNYGKKKAATNAVSPGVERGADGRLVAGQRPTECVECGHPVRGKDQKITDFPGTRTRRADGRCDHCNPRPSKPLSEQPWFQRRTAARAAREDEAAKARGWKRGEMPERCRECKRKLRRKGTPKTPDTFVHGGRGLCATCYHVEMGN